MLKLKRKNIHGNLSASETAWQLEQLCNWGISLRVRGRCAADFDGAPRDRAHARNGHDAGCFALGVPIGLAEDKLTEWDGVGARRFLLEAFQESVAEVSADVTQLGVWQERSVRDSIAHALRRRITPRSEPQTLLFAAGAPTKEKRGPRLKYKPRPPPSDRALSSAEVSTRGYPRSRLPQDAASPV